MACFPLAAMPVHAATNVTLTVWADDYALDWIRQRAADFNAQSSKWKLTVEVAACHVGESGDVIATDPQSAADVFIYSNDRLGQLISCNALLPITGDALAQVKADNSASMVDTVNGREVYCVITDAYGVSLRTKTATLTMAGSTAAIVTQPKTTAFTGNAYSVTMTEARDGRQVYCVVTDKYGKTVKSNTVTLNML